jgi:hypothetical protein
MKSVIQIALACSPEHRTRLRALQEEFSRACNAITPLVREHRCWNRVALHHMVYRSLREQFPQLGSQMVCNAIYSVCRASRAVYQAPESPFNLTRLDGRPLPLLQFSSEAPVYFDRHTMSVKQGRLSMFTLDGRIRFDLALSASDERRFHDEKLQEIVLSSHRDVFKLSFIFGTDTSSESAALSVDHDEGGADGRVGVIPDFVRVLPEPQVASTGASS